MRTITVNNLGAINVSKLDADLRAAVPMYAGLSRGPTPGVVLFHFLDNVTDAQLSTAQGIVTVHDPNVLTPEQRARADLRAVAQSAVGVAYVDLTTAQLKALLAALILESGGLANDLTIKPLNQWLR